jgi:hypothetical protein
MTGEDENYRIVAEAAFKQLEDMRSKAFMMQADYGKWLVSSLFLMHGSAIAGLMFKSGGAALPPYLFAVPWFVAGLVFALGAGFAAWWNFTFALEHYQIWSKPNMLIDREHWPQKGVVESSHGNIVDRSGVWAFVSCPPCGRCYSRALRLALS